MTTPAPIKLRRLVDDLVDRCSLAAVERLGPLASDEIQRVADQVRELGVELARKGWPTSSAERAVELADRLDEDTALAQFLEHEQRSAAA